MGVVITVTLHFDDSQSPPDHQPVAAIAGAARTMARNMEALEGVTVLGYHVDVKPDEVKAS